MSNYLEILMIIVALLLAVVIWALSAVLAMMAKKVVEHSKQVKKALIIILITSSSLFTNNLYFVYPSWLFDIYTIISPTFIVEIFSGLNFISQKLPPLNKKPTGP